MTRRGITLFVLNAVLALGLFASARPASASVAEEAKFDCCKQSVEGGYFCSYRDCWLFGDKCSTNAQCNLQ